ncbi:hypothetical protein EDB86DRAFT_2987614, partial [Lactarius hatsudake]
MWRCAETGVTENGLGTRKRDGTGPLLLPPLRGTGRRRWGRRAEVRRRATQVGGETVRAQEGRCPSPRSRANGAHEWGVGAARGWERAPLLPFAGHADAGQAGPLCDPPTQTGHALPHPSPHVSQREHTTWGAVCKPRRGAPPHFRAKGRAGRGSGKRVPTPHLCLRAKGARQPGSRATPGVTRKRGHAQTAAPPRHAAPLFPLPSALPFPPQPRHPVRAGKGDATPDATLSIRAGRGDEGSPPRSSLPPWPHRPGHPVTTGPPSTTPPCTRGNGARKATPSPAPLFPFARKGVHEGMPFPVPPL